MTTKKRAKPTRHSGQESEPERVSLAPLDPVEALKGLLATSPPPPAKKSKKHPAKG